ncbi:Hsp20/alpha crystallin family protein [uncultured Ferrovibrio sp.]|jgi:HSP20 family protein|uniref:Hsp20/alpha crystallin family protein n=1 Tax=uncultured Ferrovibrio sp. TaxID=1576913 RepID=UPI0026189255|nr:Hsp20/alpha crystallin family protein [uncultured Ferrovibrio sp.]
MANQELIPSNPLEALHKEVDRLFGGFFDDLSLPAWPLKHDRNVPKIDFKEAKTEYQLDAELPGIPAKDVQVSVANGVLTLKGEKKAEKEEKDKNYIRVERSYGRFERSFSLPADADEAKITASSKDGVLTIVIPKKEGAQQARQIEVNAAG